MSQDTLHIPTLGKGSSSLSSDSFAKSSEPVIQSMTREQYDRSHRKERVSFGEADMQLSATAIPGYHLHWINDWHPQMPQRITVAIKSGYHFVSQEEVEVGSLIGGTASTAMSDAVSRSVGTRPDGTPITAYLMATLEEFHQANLQHVADRADQIDRAIRSGNIDGKAKDGRFVSPETSVKTSNKF
ncbi:MAG: hypothetical protein ACREQ5_24795 [Candidatus Dormibacteria bacterium]